VTGVQILVVSDDEALRRLIALNLRARGATIHETTLDQALLVMAEPGAERLVLDLGPDNGEARGWEMARALRATGWARQLPLVLLGTLWPTPAQTALLQPLTFVRKPFAIGTLLHALATPTLEEGQTP
jgi:DNA-binding response OmpR family regulator